jgi:hypothetical protein
LDAVIASKDAFILYLQDEVAELKAQLREIRETPERVVKETDFKSARGYKSIHVRMREQAEYNRKNRFLETPTSEEFEEKVDTNGTN